MRLWPWDFRKDIHEETPKQVRDKLVQKSLTTEPPCDLLLGFSCHPLCCLFPGFATKADVHNQSPGSYEMPGLVRMNLEYPWD